MSNSYFRLLILLNGTQQPKHMLLFCQVIYDLKRILSAYPCDSDLQRLEIAHQQQVCLPRILHFADPDEFLLVLQLDDLSVFDHVFTSSLISAAGTHLSRRLAFT